MSLHTVYYKYDQQQNEAVKIPKNYLTVDRLTHRCTIQMIYFISNPNVTGDTRTKMLSMSFLYAACM